MCGLAVERIRVVFKNALDPLVEEKPGAVGKLIQHARGQQAGQFPLDVVDQLFGDGGLTGDPLGVKDGPFRRMSFRPRYRGCRG